MVMPDIDSYFLHVGLKGDLLLDCLIVGEALLEIYVDGINVVIL